MPPLLYILYPHLRPAEAPSSTALVDAYHFVRDARRQKVTVADFDDAGPRDEADVRQAIEVIKLFLFFTVYNVADGGLNSLMTSLAGSMTTNVSC